MASFRELSEVHLGREAKKQEGLMQRMLGIFRDEEGNHPPVDRCYYSLESDEPARELPLFVGKSAR
jgi:hypothetical protein